VIPTRAPLNQPVVTVVALGGRGGGRKGWSNAWVIHSSARAAFLDSDMRTY